MPATRRPALAHSPSADHRFAVGLARAVGGAVIFGLPLVMTMEMWLLGFSMPPGRLALMLVVLFPLLVGLSAVSGFERTHGLAHDVLDAFVAYGVGFAVSASALVLFGIVGSGESALEVVGKISLQAVPASMGALVAQTQLGVHDPEAERKKQELAFAGELFLMAAGSLLLGFNIAPTEEVSVVAARMSAWQSLATVVVSLVLMHAFVYAAEFSGQSQVPEGTPAWGVFLRYTVTGYVVVLATSAYVLWTFGRLDGVSAHEVAARVVVLGLPGSIGAAAARLLV